MPKLFTKNINKIIKIVNSLRLKRKVTLITHMENTQ